MCGFVRSSSYFSQWLAFRNSIVATNKQTSNGYCLFHFASLYTKYYRHLRWFHMGTTIYLHQITNLAMNTHIFRTFFADFQQFSNQNSNEVSKFCTFCTINTMFQWRLLYSGTVGILFCGNTTRWLEQTWQYRPISSHTAIAGNFIAVIS